MIQFDFVNIKWLFSEFGYDGVNNQFIEKMVY